MATSEEDIPSPCILVCQLHKDVPICIGCLRTRDEIASWSQADNAYKQAVLEQVEERKALGKDLFTAAN